VTVLVAVRCSDGVVIGADSIATSSIGEFPLMHIPVDSKITTFSQNIIVASTGAVGLSQRLHHHVEGAINGGVFKNLNLHECTTNISKRVLTEFETNKVRMWGQEGLRFGAYVAAPIRDELVLVEYATTDFQPEVKQGNLFFGSMGSGQMLADPFLAFVTRVLWQNKMPTVDVAKFGVYWVLDHTIKHAPGKVGPPIKLATLTKIDANWVAQEQDTQESAQYIVELEEYIARFVRSAAEDATAEPIPVPPPEQKQE
jgi:predicted proteasome-type protease